MRKARLSELRHNVCIVGTLESGKTTLARAICEAYYRRLKMRTIVLCVKSDETGSWKKMPCVFDVYGPREKHLFWPRIWELWGCVVVIEEATQTIARDKLVEPVFTGLRHREHRLIVIVHHGSELTPTMRSNTQEIFLFRQPKEVCEMWAESMNEPKLLGAQTLNQYEYLHFAVWGECVKERLSIPGTT